MGRRLASGSDDGERRWQLVRRWATGEEDGSSVVRRWLVGRRLARGSKDGEEVALGEEVGTWGGGWLLGEEEVGGEEDRRHQYVGRRFVGLERGEEDDEYG